MEDGTWIKLYRKLLKSPIWENEKALKIWIWCLIKATHIDREQVVGLQKIQLQKGQFVFGRKKASEELNMTESMIYRYIKLLQNLQMIDIKSNNKFSIVTIEKWEDYQGDIKENEQQSNNKRTTNEQQTNTNKNVKNVNKEKNNIVEIYNSICTKLPQVQKITDKRKKAIDNFLKEYTEEQFKQICELANASAFLTGNSERGWKADFDFIMKIDKATSILEGKYNNNTKNIQTLLEPKIEYKEIELTEEEYIQKLENGGKRYV